MPRGWVWLQLAIGRLPIWALYTTLLLTAHDMSAGPAALIALRATFVAASLGLVVHRLTRWVPWPQPFRPWFVLIHVAAAPVYALAWVLVTTFLSDAMHGQLVLWVPLAANRSYLLLGVWIYVIVAGTSYATHATARAAKAEALAAQSQLAALRSQLNPHFLFNALHTVVHLIPRDPEAAALAAERIAGLLRTALEEDRDEVALEDEWVFVRRYLEIEHERFGDRLTVEADLPDEALEATVPSFAVQTLVENAVRHGAAPNAGGTTIRVAAGLRRGVLTVTVDDTGSGSREGDGSGTGLARLRERLTALYGPGADLEAAPQPGGGFRSELRVPQ